MCNYYGLIETRISQYVWEKRKNATINGKSASTSNVNLNKTDKIPILNTFENVLGLIEDNL